MRAGGHRRGGGASRPPAKGTGRLPRLFFLALLLTLAVPVVNSIVASSSKAPDVTLAYLDQVRPAVDRSTAQGVELDDLRGRVPELGRQGLARGLDRLARDAAAVRDQVGDVKPPRPLRDVHPLLVASLTARAAAVASVTQALGPDLDAAPAEQAVQRLVGAGRDLALADRAYELFVESLPEASRSAMPASRWTAAGADLSWERAAAGALVSTTRASGTSDKVQDVAVITFTTEPVAVAMEGPNPVLPTSRSLRLQVVVANVGNQPQKRVPVEAEVRSDGGLDTARQFVDLGPGQRMTVPLTVRPSPVGTITLVVRAGPAAGETNIADNEKAYLFVMR